MNSVPLVLRFPIPGMTRRIAGVFGLGFVAKRSILIVCSAICLVLAFPASSFAQKKSLATCEKEWAANKVFNQAAGITKRDWVAKCRLVGAKKATNNVAPVSVPVALNRTQVKTVCAGWDRCQKACGLNGQYTCSFACGLDGCSGQCTNCSSRRVGARTIQAVVANSKRPWQ
jgi:hypothetical protein